MNTKTKRPAHRPASDAANPNSQMVVGFRPSVPVLEWIDSQSQGTSRADFLRGLVVGAMQDDSLYRALIEQGKRNIERTFTETELAWLRYSLLTTFWDMTSLPHLWREAAEAIHDAAEEEELPAEIEASVLQAKCGRMGPLEAWAFREGWLQK
jgi:hypothetical protein